ncbi:MAG: GGDEF domain-containing protein [Pseudomonadota bacterium]
MATSETASVLIQTLSSAIVLISLVIGGLAAFYIFPTVRRVTQERVIYAEKSETYRNAALTDALTGLQNRRYFDDTLNEYAREFGAIGKALGVVIIDLDHFKNINDTYGHDNGDLVLRAVSICLQQQVRAHDILARMGGEEFAIVFPNVDEYSLGLLAERVRTAIEQIHLSLDGERVDITASIGGALWNCHEPMNALLKRADQHLYIAKNNGRNQVVMSRFTAKRTAPVSNRRNRAASA